MGLIFNIVLLSIGSIYGSIYLNKRFEEMIPFTVMSVIFILFVFYMLNIVIIGYYLILLLSFIILFISIKKFIKDKNIRKSSINLFFTPGLFIFIVLFFIIYMVTKTNFAMTFDELRMWALYPKSIFITNKLMIGNDLFFSTDYYPGMSLFQYFFAKNIGNFTESNLFLSYSLVGLSFLLPITKKIKWKKFLIIFPIVILLFTFPMTFANTGLDLQYYYRSLYIDPILGISFGYSLFLSTRDLKKDKFTYILFCLSLSMIILMKVVGIALAGCVVLSFLINQIFIYKNYNFKFQKKNVIDYIKIVTPIFVVIFTFLSWQLIVKLNLDIDASSSIVSSNKIRDSLNLFLNPNADQREFLTSYISYIKSSSFIIGDLKYTNLATLPNICIFYFLVMLVLFFAVVKEKRKIIISSFIFGIFSIIIFLLLYLYIYVFTFNNTILCYERYIGAVITGISTFTLLFVYDMSSKIKKIPLYYGLILFFIILYSYNLPKISKFVYEQEIETKTNEYANKMISIIGEKNEGVNVLTIYNYCDSTTYSCVLYQHHLFLSLVDNGIYPLTSGMYLASDVTTPPLYYIKTNNDNINTLLTKFDYVFVVEDIENLDEESKELFGNKPQAGDMFKKTITGDGKLLMKKISSY